MSDKVVVLLPITVPSGPLCWDQHSDPNKICEHFDNEGGHSFCGIFKTSLKDLRGGVLKCGECAGLKKQSSDDSEFEPPEIAALNARVEALLKDRDEWRTAALYAAKDQR